MNDRLFFYGTLMSGEGRHTFLDGLAEPIGDGTIRGDLYSVGGGSFPAFVPGDGTVHGEVWQAYSRLHLAQALRVTDGIEGYRPEDPVRSMYVRETVPLLDGSGDVQTYRWNSGLHRLAPIRSGSWREHLAAQRARINADDDAILAAWGSWSS